MAVKNALTVYRVFKRKYAADPISGIGSLYASGRWNRVGSRILYTAESLSLAVIETLIHLEAESSLENYQYVRIVLPLDEVVSFPESQYEGWREDESLTQSLWQAFSSAQPARLAWRVPSAALLEGYNYLLNPQHREYSAMVRFEGPFEITTRVELHSLRK